MAATDFFTIEVWTCGGLATYYNLSVIHLSTRRVHIAGATTEPNGVFIMHVARNLTDEFDGFLQGCDYLIMDRDKKFTSAFRDFLEREGVKPVRCPPRAPTCNAIAERFVRSIKEECLEHMVLLGERSLRRALSEYEIHYLRERNHQGRDNRLLESPNVVNLYTGTIKRRERLGGMLSFYYREAA
jgi:putative transposase